MPLMVFAYDGDSEPVMIIFVQEYTGAWVQLLKFSS